MFDKAKTLKGYKLHSLDGEIGKVKEFYSIAKDTGSMNRMPISIPDEVNRRKNFPFGFATNPAFSASN